MSKRKTLKEKKEKILAVAKRKEINCTLPLTWFKLVKYASLVLAAINTLGLLYVMMNISSTFNHPDFAEKISEGCRNAFTMYCVMSVILILLDIGVCVWRYIVMTYLPKSGYKQLIIGFVSGYAVSVVSSALSAYINDVMAMEAYGINQETVVTSAIVTFIQMGIYFVINFIYFRKRSDVFDEVVDYETVSSEDIGRIAICPHCGASVPDDQMFCSKCGENF